MKVAFKKIRKIAIIVGVFFLVSLAILQVSSRILFASASHYQEQITHFASLALHKPVQIKSVHATWHGLQPVLKCRDVTVLQNEHSKKPVAHVKRVLISIDLISSYFQGKWVPGELDLSGVDVTLDATKHRSDDELSTLITQLMSPGFKTIQQLNITIRHPNGQTTQLTDINAVMKNSSKKHNIRVVASVGKRASKMHMIANLKGSYADLNSLEGQLYFSDEELTLKELQPWLPKPYKNLDGTLSGELWMSIKPNKVWQLQALHTSVKNFKVPATDASPQIDHLTGELLLNGSNGVLSLDGHNVVVHSGHRFSQTLKLKHLVAHAGWTLADENLLVSVPDWFVETQSIKLSGQTVLALGAHDQSPQVDSLAMFEVSDLAKLKTELPRKIMSPKLLSWIDRAIVSGKMHEGQILLRGALEDFPAFENSAGRFIVRGQLNDVTLDYAPGWPILDQLEGQLVFDNRSMLLTAYHARAQDQVLNNINVSIDDMANPVLRMNLKLHDAEAKKALAFVHNSPMEEGLGHEIAPIDLRGPLDINLHLRLPLKDPKKAIHTIGSLKFNGTKMTLKGREISIKNLQGGLRFTNDGMESVPISGQLFGMPMMMEIKTLHPIDDDYSHTQVRFVGDLSDQTLPPQWAKGKLRYHGNLILYRSQDSRSDELTLTSDMVGMALDLPRPLAKTQDENSPLSIHIKLGKETSSDIDLNYNDQLRFAGRMDNKGFKRAGIHFGADPAKIPETDQLFVDGILEELDLSVWAKVFLQAKSGKQSIPPLGKFELDVDLLKMFQQSIAHVRLGWEQKNHQQVITLRSNSTNGEVKIPNDYPHSAISATLDRLHFRNAVKSQHSTMRPCDLPPLNITINDFSYEDLPLGRFQLSMTPEDDTLRINELSFKSKLMSFSVSGHWSQFLNHHTTALSGALYTHNLGRMLNVYDFTSNLIGGDGRALFNLSWDDSFLNYEIHKLNGKVKFDFSDAQIVRLSQQAETQLGLGRILNLFSLQTLPRRLNLDFSDLTKQGFIVDTLSGNFVLRDGNAFSKDAKVKGPVAQVAMFGRLGLSDKDYHLDLEITPHVTASLPVVATVAGGPVAGVATWVAEKVFRRAVNKVTSAHYQVTGPWEHPNIRRSLS